MTQPKFYLIPALQIMLCLFLFSNIPAFAQQDLNDVKITLADDTASFAQILRQIENSTNFKFSYLRDEVPLNKKITIQVEDESLYKLLMKLASKYGLQFKRINNQIVVSKAKNFDERLLAVPQGPASLRGKILDAATGEALIGANVIVQGTSMGAASDMDGNYAIPNIPAGNYSLRVSYIGYKTIIVKINLKSEEHLTKILKLEAVGITGKEVVVTAQASGQNAAINQQLASNKIVNVVSSARIQDLPDANAAESVGRLPGVSVTRSGGEANGVVIRGMDSKYNMIMIDGVEMAPTNASSRATDLSMISSNTLSGIEVYKTVTPDMDAAVLGGVVNFKLREAKKAVGTIPTLNFLAQGGYNQIVSKYNNYKFVASAENRYFNDKLGVFAQGIVERVNHTSDNLGASYDVTNTKILNAPHDPYMTSMTLSFAPRLEDRYDGTLVLDYKLPAGKISLMNLGSQSNTTTITYQNRYPTSGNDIYLNDSYSFQTYNVFTNLLDYEQSLPGSINMDVKISHAFSENTSPDNYSMNFWQQGAGVSGITNTDPPDVIARAAYAKIKPSDLIAYQISTSHNYTKTRNINASIDLSRTFNFSDEITATLKAGGDYKYTGRWHNQMSAGANIYTGSWATRAAIVKAFPWMQNAPYNYNPNGSNFVTVEPFMISNFSYGNFLNGDYNMGPATNLDLIHGAIAAVIDTSAKEGGKVGSRDYIPDNRGLFDGNYNGHEDRSAGYIMATISIGPNLTVIPGVRYQGLFTSYTAPIITNPSSDPYPVEYPHRDTTMNRFHGYWLPDISLIYKPLTWLNIRAAYTTTISYPDFTQLTPLVNVVYGNNPSVTWHNYNLNPAHSQNYDLAVSVYNNNIGLFTAGGFLKQIDGLIFGTGDVYPLKNWTAFPEVPPTTPNLAGYTVNYSINNPYRTNVWGAEVEWQTHFWYLPNPFNGLVMNVNYTHIFSKAKYPYAFLADTGSYPRIGKMQVQQPYYDRLYNQPNDIANLSIGYDYKGFSILVSMIYKANVFTGTNFWPDLRNRQPDWTRWDISAKQSLPWNGLQVYLDINNINGQNDISIEQGTGYPSSSQDYGMTADLGIRWSL